MAAASLAAVPPARGPGAAGGCNWGSGELEYSYCCAGVHGPRGWDSCWDGGDFTPERCCPVPRRGWEMDGSPGLSWIVPQKYFAKDIYWNMSTYLKFLVHAGPRRRAQDKTWMVHFSASLSRLNHALAQMTACARLTDKPGCTWMAERPRVLRQLESLGATFSREVQPVLRMLRRDGNFSRLSAVDGTSAAAVAQELTSDVLAKLRQLADSADPTLAPEDDFGPRLHDLSGWLGESSVLSSYRLLALAWYGDGRYGSEKVQQVRFRQDLGFTRMQVISSLLRMLGQEGNRSSQPRSLRMAEIGVFRAGTSSHVLQENSRLRWLGVDTYQGMWAKHRIVAEQNLHPFKARAKLLDMPSEAVTDAQVPLGSLDLVFIDGDHSEEHATLDIRQWAPRVRRGGIVAGHDHYDAHYEGVSVAVHNLIPPRTLLEVAPDHVFFWRVP